MDRFQYLIVLGACLLLTLPLEIFGAGVYRQARRAAAAILPVAAVFIVWDVIAIVADVWGYNPQFVTGIGFPQVPVEELMFFIVIPLCGLLTYNAVDTILEYLKRRLRTRSAQSS
ncbi:lycopene cyclase domain-containing protein [Mycolicibacterium baixiangningiae]|uniref:lycopene cyclase domain-containing protein n=1 Tax=Mycolicibacterium baixiangningiae TaxID=2761578 RepID=UPI0018D09DAB|nr:lycopene cyclase domain-containing protein [Mycolicibacterium baixiangningiae]